MLKLEEVVEKTRLAVAENRKTEADRQGVTVDELDALRVKRTELEGRIRAIAASGITLHRDDFARLANDQLETSKPLAHVKRWLGSAGARPMLILCGAVGVGKTLAAAWAIAERRDGVAVRSPDLGMRVFPYTNEMRAGVVEANIRSALFVLDDLGDEDLGDQRWRRAFGAWVEARQMYGVTLVTTNLLKRQFRDRYDARAIDRLNAIATAIEIGGESLREKGGGL